MKGEVPKKGSQALLTNLPANLSVFNCIEAGFKKEIFMYYFRDLSYVCKVVHNSKLTAPEILILLQNVVDVFDFSWKNAAYSLKLVTLTIDD